MIPILRTSLLFLFLFLAKFDGGGDLKQETVAAPYKQEIILAQKDQHPKGALAKQSGRKLALLIGCTKYDHGDQIPLLKSPLRGPANDVILMRKTLKERFSFPDKDIVTLAEGPGTAGRPTYANIVAAFEDLLGKADDQSQVVILFSGHGSQIPIPETQLDPLDPQNPEPDGLDEIFLPVDVHQNSQGKLERYILDNQVGVWLDRFREKGAAVWIIFDCCHSGTMDRGGVDDIERPREIKAEALGVPRKEIEAAVQRAAEAVRKAKDNGRSITEESSLDFSSVRKNHQGSVVAFYAAQSFETAPELPRPRGAPAKKENYYGLLTYSLIQVLDQQSGKLTYRELAQALVARYQAERSTRAPTPYCDGDLDCEVLGVKEWPHRSRVILHKDKMEVNAGELTGLTRGAILALHPPAGNKLNPKAILGYVQVTELTPTTARVSPCKYHDKGLLSSEKIPDLASCALVSRDFGDMKLQYALAVPNLTQATLLVEAIKALDKEVQDMIKEVPVNAADWLLTVKGKSLQLRHGEGRKVALDEDAEPEGYSLATVAKSYDIGPIDQSGSRIAENLSRDLARVFTWQSLWRIAGCQSVVTLTGENNLNLFFQVTKIKDGKPAGPLVNGASVHPGQKIHIHLHNRGVNDLWVTLLILEADFKIQSRTFSLKAGTEVPPLRGIINGKSTGKEGIIVLAGPLNPTQVPPDLSFLDQPPLKDSTALARDVSRGLQTPFGRLLASARSGQGTRSFDFEAPTNPIMLTWTWVAVNPKGK